MSENKTPKIRFPGFTDSWEQRKLGEVLEDLYNGQTPSRLRDDYWNGTINWLSSGELNRGIVYECAEKITTAGQGSAHLRLVPAGTFIMAITGLEAAGTRGNCAILGLDTTLNQSCMALFPNKALLIPEFLFQWYRMIGEEYGIRFTQGTKQQSYNAEIIKTLEITLPSVHEQKEIADFLANLDKTITLHQRKLDQMKECKKGLLQKMFPKDGESVPEIRFPGFTDAWEQRRFSDLVIIERGGSPRPIDDFITDAPNGLNWIKIGDAPEMGNYIMKTAQKIRPDGLKKTREVHPGDLILSNSMSFGRPYIMAIDGCIHDGWLLIRDEKKHFDLKFLCSLLGTDSMLNQYKSMAAGSTVNNLNKELVGGTTVSYPSIAEQVRIGEFISSIDKTITLHQRKLDQMKDYKKGLLQQMFV